MLLFRQQVEIRRAECVHAPHAEADHGIELPLVENRPLKGDRFGREAGGKSEANLRLMTGQHVSAFFADDLQQTRSEEHTSELQSQSNLVCRLLLEKKKKKKKKI